MADGREPRRRHRPTAVAFAAVAAGLALGAASPAGAQGGDPTAAPKPPAPSQDWYVGATFTTNSAGWGLLMPRGESPGALVVLVIAGSPAEAGGLSSGDVIVAMDSRPITNDRQPGLVLRTSTGASHDLTVVGPNRVARQARVEARARPAAGLDELVTARIAADPSPASRLLFAQVAPDAATALTVLDQLIDEFPSLAEAYASRAQRLLDVGVARNNTSDERLAAIRAAIDRAAALDPASLAVQLTAAQVLATLRQDGAAVGHAERAVAIDESSSTAHYLLGALRLGQGDARRALPDLRRAVGLDPYDRDSYRALSEAYRAIGRPQLARDTDRALGALVQAPRRQGPRGGSLLAVGLAAVVVVGAGAVVASAGWSRTELTRSPASGPRGLVAVEVAGTLALLSILVPCVGRALDLSAGAPLATEIVDHVAPGAVALAAATLALRRAARSKAPPRAPRSSALVIGLGAFWITATHLPLSLEAAGGRVRVETALFHSAAGVAMLLMAAMVWRAPPWTLGFDSSRRHSGQSARRPPSRGRDTDGGA